MVDVKALMQAAKNTTAPSCEERMALYNSRRGDLTGYDCPICRNKGFTAGAEKAENIPIL